MKNNEIKEKDKKYLKEKESLLAEDTEIIKTLAEELPKITAQITKVRRTEIHSGPLPDPDTLERYKKISPELVETIISMAKNQSDHRIDIEKKVIESNISAEKRGQNFAFILFFVMIIGSFILIYFGKNIGIASLVAVFVSGIGLFLKTKQNQDNEIKKKDLDMLENLPEEKSNKD